MSGVARECGVHGKVAEAYFGILEDLMIAVRIPVFARRAKRRLVAHPKFYFFDAGVFRAIRPKGPLDSLEEAGGVALETLVLQHLRAANDYGALGYAIYYWRTALGEEVDFILYGERGMHAFEVKSSERLRDEDFRGLRRLSEDYPAARCYLLYPGVRRWHERGVDVLPLNEALPALAKLL